jgi:hypothetical protein
VPSTRSIAHRLGADLEGVELRVQLLELAAEHAGGLPAPVVVEEAAQPHQLSARVE